MRIDKLHTIDSTNEYLKRISKKGTVTEDIVAWSLAQTAGKGQMGTTWVSDTDKNLTFSILKNAKVLKVGQQFYPLMAASLAVKDVLQKLFIKNVRVKWPNDILTDSDKICGILIESIIKGRRFEAMIIGVGLNVNQTSWTGIPRATSIKSKTGIQFDLEEVLNMLLTQFHIYVEKLVQGKFEEIKKDYEAHLFRKDKPSTFIRDTGEQFTGIIKGVTDTGKLRLLEEDDVTVEYDLKEIELRY